MVNHGQSWSIMVNHGQSWSIMVKKHGQKTWSKNMVKKHGQMTMADETIGDYERVPKERG
jgi:hypothetical protein